LSDGTNTASINFSGDYVLENFKFQSDGSAGTLVVDPPVQTASNSSVDQFVFAPATGPTPVQHTIADFNPSLGMIDLRLFGNIVKSASDLIQNHLTQQGVDALLQIDVHDSILLKNVQALSLHTGDFIVHT
jgi:hypothetical protein